MRALVEIRFWGGEISTFFRMAKIILEMGQF
jgi:hypothetical protein